MKRKHISKPNRDNIITERVGGGGWQRDVVHVACKQVLGINLLTRFILG